MDVCLVIKERLEQLGLEQKDLAAAAEVTESYVSQLLTRKKSPPAPDRRCHPEPQCPLYHPLPPARCLVSTPLGPVRRGQARHSSLQRQAGGRLPRQGEQASRQGNPVQSLELTNLQESEKAGETIFRASKRVVLLAVPVGYIAVAG